MGNIVGALLLSLSGGCENGTLEHHVILSADGEPREHCATASAGSANGSMFNPLILLPRASHISKTPILEYIPTKHRIPPLSVVITKKEWYDFLEPS